MTQPLRFNRVGRIALSCGGTRGNAVKRGRVPLYDPSACPFEKNPQEEVASYEIGGEKWRIVKALYTQIPQHWLIIPSKCWNKETLWQLGGVKRIQTAIEIAANTISNLRLDDALLGIHVGWMAGQNLWHAHWHLRVPVYPPDFPHKDKRGRPSTAFEEELMLSGWADPTVHIADFQKCRIFAGGYRAGSCFIVPHDGDKQADENAYSFADALSWLITQANTKFANESGPPEYRVDIRFVDGSLNWILYVPILNHLGVGDDFGLITGTAITLPWPHSATAECLQK